MCTVIIIENPIILCNLSISLRMGSNIRFANGVKHSEWENTASKEKPKKSLQWPGDKTVQIKQSKSLQFVYIQYSFAFAKKQAVTLATMPHFTVHMPLWTNTLKAAPPHCMLLSIMSLTALCRSPLRVKTIKTPLGSCQAGQADRRPSAVFHAAPQDQNTT